MTDQNAAPAEPTATKATEPGTAGKSGRKRWITPLLALVAAIAIGLFGGILIGHGTASNAQAGAPAGFRSGGQGGGGIPARGGFTSGTIESIDGDTITLKLTDGSTVKVTTSSSTTVSKTAKSTVSALAKGDEVAVVGAADSNGNVTATSVSEGALIGGFGGRPRPGGANAGN